MAETYNFLDNLMASKEIERYQSIMFPKNIDYLKEILDKKLEEDPDYEVFVQLMYYRLVSKIRIDNSPHVVSSPYLFISNKGRVLSTVNKEPLIRVIHPNKNDYPQVIISSAGNKNISIVVHRAMACTFVPVLKKHSSYHPKELEVNHIDGDKANFSRDNLEWATRQENVEHAIKLGLTVPKESRAIKVTVVRGGYAGTSFLIYGPSDMRAHGMDQGAVSNALAGKLDTHRNCSYTWANDEDKFNLPVGASRDIIKSLIDTNPIAKFKFIGTNLKTGEVVEVIGDNALKAMGFSHSGVRNAVAGLTNSSGGYTWIKVPIQ